MLDDHNGNYWAHSTRGVWRAKKTDLHAVADGQTNWLQCVSYGVADGMVSSESNIIDYQRSACRSADGRLWFSGAAGLVAVDPAKAISDEVLVPAVIEQVLAGDEAVYGDGVENSSALSRPRLGSSVSRLRLPALGNRALKIRFTARSFIDSKLRSLDSAMACKICAGEWPI